MRSTRRLLAFLLVALFVATVRLGVSQGITVSRDNPPPPFTRKEAVPLPLSGVFTEGLFDDPEEQARLTQAVRDILPEGWAVQRTTNGTVPPAWATDLPRAGFCVEAGKGSEAAAVWFLPPDWVGIRKGYGWVRHANYWEGILATDHYLTISNATNRDFPERVERLFGGGRTRTPSLSNGGYQRAVKVFAGKTEAADQVARSLIRRHCATTEECSRAAHSLRELGVPAKSAFLRAAREDTSMNRDLFFGILAQMGGEDAIATLCELVVDPDVSEYHRKYAVMSLQDRDDPQVIRALQRALRELRNEEAIATLARGPALLRHAAAAPDFLAALKRMTHSIDKCEVAHALAALRYQEAIPEINRFIDELRASAKDLKDPYFVNRDLVRAELALLRLTGGDTPGESVRVLIRPPIDAVLGEKLYLSVLVENVGSEDSWSHGISRYNLWIDGHAPPPLPQWSWGGGMRWRHSPGQYYEIHYDLSEFITTPGQHRVQCRFGGAESNIVLFVVEPEKVPLGTTP